VLKLVRRLLELGLVVFVVGMVSLAVAAQAAPLAGYGLYAVRSASMTPAIEVGSLVIAQHVDPAVVQPGDVITVKARTGATVTHRVVTITPNDAGPVFSTRGDANASPDPVATRADQLQGRVAGQVPLLGFLLAMLAMPSGVVAVLSIGAALATAVWLVDDLEADAEAEAEHEEELEELDRRARGLGGGQAVLR
jgi:signal peptidase